MAWLDNYRQAKFRGVEFIVPESDTSGGRRGAIHEFPKRDVPYVEDMGRRAKRFSVEAYIVGDDYMTKRDALIVALDTEGTGKLVHPYLGTIDVFCTNYSFRESGRETRIVHFSISFVESGLLKFPTTIIDTVSEAALKKDAALQANNSAFVSKYNIVNKPFSIQQNVIATLDKAIDSIGESKKSMSAISEFQRNLGIIAAMTIQLAYDALEMSEGITSLMTFGTNEDDASAATADNARQQNKEMKLMWEFSPDDTLREDDPSILMARFVQINAVINSLGLLSIMDYDSLDEALSLRTDVFTKLEELLLSETDDDLYTALYALQTSVSEDIDKRGAELSRLASYTLNNSLPALVVAHDLYGSIDQEQDIIDRNKIEHPCFVPGGIEIEVLINV